MAEAMAQDGPERLEGTLERVRFESDDGEFAVCDLDVPGRSRPVKVVGNLMSARPGEEVEVVGRWENDPEYGRQFSVESVELSPPKTKEGVEKYLASDFVEGIGEVLAERIADHFGEEALEILDDDPERVREVDGIGEVRGEEIAEAWREQRSYRSVVVFLQSHGVSASRAMRIWKQYGPRAASLVRENPYRLAEDVRGIGFKRADAIARELGIDRDAPERLRAGLVYELVEADDAGHVYLPREALLESAAERLDVAPAALEGPLEGLEGDESVIVDRDVPGDDAVYRPPAYWSEKGAADHLVRLLQGDPWIDSATSQVDLGERLESVERHLGFELAGAQREAVEAALAEEVVVVTGGPGTGKTTIVRAICRVGESVGEHVALAAPTGRAAKRMSEATGREAQTIHRLLEYDFEKGGFRYDEDEPLDVDTLVVDEASMLDIFLFHSVVRALPASASLVLVGDVDQLPSVGAGDVLDDLMASDVVRVVELTEIFRQAEHSGIVVNAHRINRGEMPVAPEREKGELVDFYTVAADDAGAARDRVVRAVADRIPEAFGYDPVREIQTLSPMHRGDVGCRELNERLQARLHPEADGVDRLSNTWKVGDRVMQTRNNYDLEVFNGDVGIIRDIDEPNDELHVAFGDRTVRYSFAMLDELALAYAVTVHKSQGSEYPAVVIPVVTQHYVMLKRKLLYTAVTRAKNLVVLVGSKKAVRIAVENDEADRRYTHLETRLRRLVS